MPPKKHNARLKLHRLVQNNTYIYII